MILARYQFKEECDRMEFLKLAISNLMNYVLCFSKKKEFVEVGRICSIVLEFDPYNVKAMYKRAMAAIELGKRDWARLDLWMALDVDPNNKEVIKKLEEIKDSPSNDSASNPIPSGLGLGLPPPKMKKGEVKDKEGMTKQHSDLQVHTSCKNAKDQQAIAKDSIGIQEKGEEEIIMPTTQKEDGGELQEQVSITKEPEVIKSDAELSTITDEGDMLCTNCNDVVMNDRDLGSLEEQASPGRSSSSCLIEEHILSAGNECSKQAESKYRVHNRKRQGSCLMISKNDYNAFVQEKTIKCYNSQLGSFMEISIARNHAETLLNKSKDHPSERQDKLCSEVSDFQSNLEEEVQDNSDIMQSMEVLFGVSPCMAYEENQADRVEGNYSSPSSSKVSYFVFSSNPNPMTRTRRVDAVNNALSKHQAKSIKRRKLATCDRFLPPNIVSVCKFDYIRKRKGTFPPLGFNYHPRKKLATHAPSYSCNIECPCSSIQGRSIKSGFSSSEFSLVKICTNNDVELQGCLQASEVGETVRKALFIVLIISLSK